MSDDLPTRDPSGGYLVLPRRVRMAAVITAISVAAGAGSWVAVLHADTIEAKDTSERALEEVENIRGSVRRMERYLCLDCTQQKTFDCTDICGVRRLEHR